MSATRDVTNQERYRFDRHTAVEDDRFGPWQAQIAPEITGFGGTHGGYLAAIALRALAKITADPARAPRSLSLQLLAPVNPGALHLHPRLERAGSSVTGTSLRIEQDGQTTGTAQGLFGLPTRAAAHLAAPMPDVPPPQECRPLSDKPAPEALVGLQVEHRPAAPPLPLTGARRAELLVWMRLVEDRPLDAISATMIADAAPPALFATLTHVVRMPSIEMTLHFSDIAALVDSPWALAVVRTSYGRDGYASEDGELWTPGGQLALRIRQLRRILGE